VSIIPCQLKKLQPPENIEQKIKTYPFLLQPNPVTPVVPAQLPIKGALRIPCKGCLTDYLKSLGHRVLKSSVVDWLVASEDAWLLFNVNIFSNSPTRIGVNPRKVYCIDHALVASVSSAILTNRDSLLEKLVFTALRRVTPEIFYHKTKTNREVDLVALLPSMPGQERTILLVQVCASLADPRVRQSEIRSLSEAMVELAVAEGTIVTWGHR
jgi:hypothetical protein